MSCQNKKVGIMGGTFDPIHYGHLMLAQNALDTFSLDEILFVPSGTPWLKESTKVLSKNKRVSMTGMAIEDNPDFALSTIEIDREGNSYSYETVEELKREQPDTDFYFIMGADSLLEIERWKHPDRLMADCTLLVAVRDDCDKEGLKKQIAYLTDKYQADIRILPANRMDISSTRIRQMIQEGKSVRYMLPDQVIRFIQKNHLYQQETSSEN
ncbi:nicotinate-nucleotide adenylyltransferase [Kineothrix sp. MSJ-39]|uniref:nicotinate-nucleotide adenylyltransferase n=1 Tax=Kineothrix sp. MSJ-39 TaxID=2841533 RepID=UPI00209DCB02|nr:nicotinate-nucleotide adenylyltransferase [Kineothrix sp. MSJ-39]